MGSGRIPLWDNARFARIVLVVMGHTIQRQTLDSDNALTLYLFVYAFHMPTFAIISGYFSKASPPGARQMRRIITDFLLPYLIFEAIWSLVQFLVEGRPVFNPTEPSWTLWFLLALAILRLVLPYLVLLRWPLAWAVVIAADVDGDRWRDLGSTVWAWRALAAAAFSGWLVVVALHVPAFRAFNLKHWFFYDDS